MIIKKEKLIPNEFVLIISGMPGVGKSSLALNLVKKYNEFRSLNQMNLLRFATKYFNNELSISNIQQFGLRFLTHEEGKKHMQNLVPIIREFIKRQIDKKIPTILEGVDFYPPYLYSFNSNDFFLEKVLFINLYCSEESIHYKRLTEREKLRQQNPSRVDLFFKNIRKKNNLLYHDIEQFMHPKIKNIDVAFLNKEQVLKRVEDIIKENNLEY